MLSRFLKPKVKLVSEDMSIMEITSIFPLSSQVFIENGIKFIGNNLSPLESLKKVGKGNGLSEEKISEIVKEINRQIKHFHEGKLGGEPFFLTDKAAEELKKVLKNKVKKAVKFRLYQDACGLFTYDVDFGNKKQENEVAIRKRGINFHVDRKSILMIQGTTIDFRDGGFYFDNPNVRK